MNTRDQKLKEFETALRKHDWTFQMSDDHRFFAKGQKERSDIKKLAVELENLGILDAAKELWVEIAPNVPMMNVQFPFLFRR